MGNEPLPFVSVIIPALNEAHNIRYCLEALVHQNYPDDRYEIIVVDNGSSDNTTAISEQYAQFTYTFPGVTVSALRNFGSQKAKGEIYAFIDADCVADRDWLSSAVLSLKKDLCITGAEVRIPPEARWIERSWFSRKNAARQDVSHINSANLIVTAEVFNRVGGFNEALVTGEDYEFSMRARKFVKVISDDTIRVTHYGNPKTLLQFLRREIWHGLGSVSSFKIHRFDKPLISTVLFLICSLLQVISIAYAVLGKANLLFVYSSAVLLSLLITTILYRIRNRFEPRYSLQLILLYYVYYLGRSISFIYILMKKNYSHYTATKQ